MNDEEYAYIVSNIINNKRFCELKREKHHENSNRFRHCVDVSYKTYKVCKKLKLDYKSATRAALLHDFFFDDEFDNKRESLFKHGKKAIENSLDITKLSEKEKSIISSHMFPVGGKIPKNMESLVVLTIDNAVSVNERVGLDFKYLKEGFNFIFTLIIAFILK